MNILKKKANSYIRKPNAILYYSAGLIVKVYYRLIYHHSVDNAILKDIKPPYLVVAGHSSWLDYAITTASVFPIRMNYVGAYNFFRDRLMKIAFTIMGVIPKYQFTNDLGAVKTMKSVIDRRGIVAIFPNGCLSNEGRPGGFAVFSIAKLIRFLNVPVIAIKTDGGYLTRPRWTKQARRGRLETKVFQLLTVAEINSLSEADIYNRVISGTAFDDFKWQREKMIEFKGRDLAEGVEYVLYKCAKCREEFTLRSEGDRLICTACGNSVRMNKYLFFEPEGKDSLYFDGIDKWFDYQKECLEREIEHPEFEMNAETELKCAEPGKYGYQHLGHGTVRITRNEITYAGTVNGQVQQCVFPMKSILMVPYAAGEYIEIARGPDISRFVFDDLTQQIKWVMAIRQIRDRYYERANEDEAKERTLSKVGIR